MTDATQKEWNRIMSERIVGNAPKPATPEAPEWKIAPPPRALLDLADMELKARQEVCGITDLMRGVSSAKPPEWKLHPTHTWNKPLTGSGLNDRNAAHCVTCGWMEWTNFACQPCDGGEYVRKHDGNGTTAPLDHSPLDRALDDFIARRKAKREVNAAPTREEIIAEKQSRWAAEDRARLVARALSTPLPHDPPMSARLMPWRGKE